jgi:hypothetical protein
MKIGLAVATADALPSAFVVFRDDLGRCVKRCAELGYDGVELALLRAEQVNVPEMKRQLVVTGLEVPCISSEQVFAADRLYFTHPDQGCFRHPVLLRGHRKTRIVYIDQHGRVEEHYSNISQRPKMQRRGEDLPERQPPCGQSRLHGWCPDFTPKFQGPVRPHKVVMAAK